MKAYVLTTGSLFVVIVIAHIARAFVEGLGVARDPWFMGMTALALALIVWAWRVLRQLRRS